MENMHFLAKPLKWQIRIFSYSKMEIMHFLAKPLKWQIRIFSYSKMEIMHFLDQSSPVFGLRWSKLLYKYISHLVHLDHLDHLYRDLYRCKNLV